MIQYENGDIYDYKGIGFKDLAPEKEYHPASDDLSGLQQKILERYWLFCILWDKTMCPGIMGLDQSMFDDDRIFYFGLELLSEAGLHKPKGYQEKLKTMRIPPEDFVFRYIQDFYDPKDYLRYSKEIERRAHAQTTTGDDTSGS